MNGAVRYKKAKVERFLGILKYRIEKCTSDILIADGYGDIQAFENEEIIASVRIWAGEKPDKRTAVIVSSYSFSVKVEEKVDELTRVDEFQKLSWTRDEYIAAFKRARPDSDFGMKVSKRRRIQGTSNNTVAAAAADDDDEDTGFSIKPSGDDGGGDGDDAVATRASDQTALTEELLEDIDEKLYYAGGCARYFFGFSIEEVKLSIEDAVNALNKTDIGEVLQRGFNHPETRHRLVAFFEEEDGSVVKRIVSQFAVQKLAERHGEDAFPFLYKMGGDNPSFEGWVFEADFFFQYRRASERQQVLILKGDVLSGEDDVELNAESIIPFDHDGMAHKEENGEAEGTGRVMEAGLSHRQLQQLCIKAGLLASGRTNALLNRLLAHKADGNSQKKLRENLRKGVSKMWLPKKWHQGGYDSFYVFPDPENETSVIIWFFQVTRGSSHDLKLKFFVEVVNLFLDAGLEVSDCQIYFVVPERSKTRVASVTPHGKLFYEKFGWVNGQEKDKIHVVSLKKTSSY